MAKQGILYIISVVLMRGISLVMLPLVALYLTPAELGALEALTGIAIVGSVLVGAGLESALFRFASSSCEQRRNRSASMVYLMALALAISFFVLSATFFNDVSVVLPFEIDAYFVLLTMLVLCFESVISVPLGFLRMTDRAGRFCFSVVFRTVVHAALTVLFLYLGRGVGGVLEASLAAVVIQAFILGRWHLGFVGAYFCKRQVKPVLVYAWPIVASGLLAFLMNGFDRWSIAAVSSMDDLAFYGVAIKFSLALSLLVQPFGMWWMPRRFQVLDENKRTYQKCVAMGLLSVTAAFLFLGMTVPYFIELMLPEVYVASVPMFLCLLVGFYFKEITELINVGCFYGETNTQLVLNVAVTVLAVTLFMIIGPTYGAMGIAISVAVAYLVRFLGFLHFSQREVPLNYNLWVIFKLFVLSCFGVMAHNVGLDGGSHALSIVVQGGVIIGIVIIVIKSRLFNEVASALGAFRVA